MRLFFSAGFFFFLCATFEFFSPRLVSAHGILPASEVQQGLLQVDVVESEALELELCARAAATAGEASVCVLCVFWFGAAVTPRCSQSECVDSGKGRLGVELVALKYAHRSRSLDKFLCLG
jgi:hypothetical protein